MPIAEVPQQMTLNAGYHCIVSSGAFFRAMPVFITFQEARLSSDLGPDDFGLLCASPRGPDQQAVKDFVALDRRLPSAAVFFFNNLAMFLVLDPQGER